jgi:hypothetical protein
MKCELCGNEMNLADFHRRYWTSSHDVHWCPKCGAMLIQGHSHGDPEVEKMRLGKQ